MKKYLVDVYLPAAMKHYDVFLPSGKLIGETTKLLVNIAESLSPGEYKGTPDSVLINAESGDVYDCSLTVYDAGIRNSTKLILT